MSDLHQFVQRLLRVNSSRLVSHARHGGMIRCVSSSRVLSTHVCVFSGWQLDMERHEMSFLFSGGSVQPAPDEPDLGVGPPTLCCR